MKRETYHHGNLRSALVAAGLSLLERQDLHEISLRAIAAQAGVSHAAPKNHFGSLQGLLTAMAEEGFRRHRAAMLEGLDDAASRETRLFTAMRGYIRFARGNPNLYKLMFTSGQHDPENAPLQEAATASYDVLRDISTGLIWERTAEQPDPQWQSEIMLWSFVHGFAHLMINGGGGLCGGAEIDVVDFVPKFRYAPEG